MLYKKSEPKTNGNKASEENENSRRSSKTSTHDAARLKKESAWQGRL
jgi:hypothetical protein